MERIWAGVSVVFSPVLVVVGQKWAGQKEQVRAKVGWLLAVLGRAGTVLGGAFCPLTQ